MKTHEEVKQARNAAKTYLAFKSSTPSIDKSNKETSIEYFKKADKECRNNFGVVEFSETTKPYADSQYANIRNDELTTRKTLLNHIVAGPHVTKTKNGYHSSGGIFDIWNSGPKKSYSFTYQDKLQLNPKMSISNSESEYLEKKVVDYLKDTVYLENPEHKRQVVLATMLLNVMRLHCNSSQLRLLSRSGTSLFGITKDFEKETFEFVQKLSKLPDIGYLSEMAEDVKDELGLEVRNWRATNVGSNDSFFHYPVTFSKF